jgi:hypothetical protein
MKLMILEKIKFAHVPPAHAQRVFYAQELRAGGVNKLSPSLPLKSKRSAHAQKEPRIQFQNVDSSPIPRHFEGADALDLVPAYRCCHCSGWRFD